MVLAVPITPQVPAWLGRGGQHRRYSAGKAGRVLGRTVGASSSFSEAMSSTSIVPARNLAQLLRQSVQAPTRTPLKLPGIMGPVTRWTAGLLAEMAPMS